MDIRTVIEAFIQSELQKFFTNRELVQPGETLTGRVVETRDDGKTLIDFGRFRALADVKFPVQQGEVMKVNVLETGDRLRLALEIPEKAVTPEVRRLALQLELPEELLRRLPRELAPLLESPAPPPVRQAVDMVQRHFTPPDPADVVRGALQLKATVEHSGVFFEKRVERALQQILAGAEKLSTRELVAHPDVRRVIAEDLKPNLLILKEFLGRREAETAAVDEPLRQAARQVDELLEHLENRQQEAVTRREGGAEQFQAFTFPLPVPQGGRGGKLKVYLPHKEKGKARPAGYRVALLLDMDRLKMVRGDFFLLQSDLAITIYVMDRAVQEYFRRHSAELYELLKAHFHSLTIDVRTAPQQIAAFDSEDLLLVEPTLVDLKA